jgi:LCP family protein required for cell wall assembly
MADQQTRLTPRRSRAAVRKSKKKRSIGLTLLKVTLITMLLILLALVGYGIKLYFDLQGTLDGISIVPPEEQKLPPEERADQRPLSILLLGIDYREATRTMLTDVIMIAALNPNSKTATLVSVPRDTYMDPAGLKPSKANSFYSTYLYANLSEAPKDREERERYAMRKIKELYAEFLGLDQPIDYVGIVDFKSFVDIVDLYGGLTLHVDQNMCHRDYADGTNINLQAGIQTLDGKQTLDFVRYRKSMNCPTPTKESNDFERNMRQQQVISELLKKVMTVDGVAKIPQVLDVVSDRVKTDIPKDQINALIQTYLTIDIDKINYEHLEGRWDGRYVHLSPEDVAEASMKLKQQLRPEGPPPEDDAQAGDGNEEHADGSTE